MSQQHPRNPEELRDAHERLQGDIQHALIDHLSEYPLFDEDAPIAQYITDRVRALCDDTEQAPTVYVRDSPEDNACVVGDALVFDRGLFDLMEYTEEIDGVLGHELTHFTQDHVHKNNTDEDSVLSQLGNTRVHEIEADVRGMLLVNQAGINPRGYVSALEKLADKEERTYKEHVEQDASWAYRVSPTHGDTRERAVNLEQAAWLFDMQHLSPAPLTPLPLTPEQYGTVARAQDTDDPNRGQAAIIHHFKKLQRLDYNDQEKLDQLAEQEASLIQQHNPFVNEEDARKLAEIGLSSYGFPIQVAGTVEAAKEFLDCVDHPVLQELVGAMDNRQRVAYARYAFTAALSHENVSLESVKPIIDFYRETFKTDRAEEFAKDVAEQAAEATSPAQQRVLAQIYHYTNATLDILPGFSMLLFGGAEHEYKRRQARVNTVLGITANMRYHEALSLEDTVDFLRYICSFENITTEIPTFNSDGEHVVRQAEFSRWYATAFEANTNFDTSSLTDLDYVDYSRKKDESYIPHALRRMPDEVTKRFAMSCINIKPDNLARQLRTRDDISYEDKIDLVHTWLDHRSIIPRINQETDLSVLALLASVHSPRAVTFIENIVENSLDANNQSIQRMLLAITQGGTDKRATSDRTKNYRFSRDLDTIFGLAREAILQGVGDDTEYANALFEDLIEKSAAIGNYRTLSALEKLALDHKPEPLLELIGETTPSKLTGKLFTYEGAFDLTVDYWDKAVEYILASPDALEDEDSLRLLMALGMIADDIEVNLHVPGQALARLIEKRSFEDGMELVLTTYGHLPSYVKAKAIDILVEQKASSFDDFERLESTMMHQLESFIGSYSAKIGGGSIFESVIIAAYKNARAQERESALKHEVIHNAESVKLIKALLTSAQSDRDIKSYVFERWWHANRFNPDNEQYFNVEDILTYRHPGKEARLNFWTKEMPPANSYDNLTQILDKMYLSDESLRFLLVRKLMLGEGGVLKDESGKDAIIESFMSSWLTGQSEEASALLRNILGSFLNSDTAEHVYQYIGPVLQDLILKPPKETSSNRDIAVAKAEAVVQSLVDRGKVRASTLRGVEVPAVRNKIFYLMHGTSNLDQIRQQSQTTALMERFEVERSDDFARISPTELALMTGKKSGALGIRMLQLAGQYYSIPEEERHAFNEVYDSMKGQKRLQAHKVLLREAKNNPHMSALLDNIDHFGTRLGGGSLMTVYHVRMKNGQDRVIGVRNPNAEYHVVAIANILQKTLAQASSNDPNNLDLLMAESLLTDAVTWIRDELNDTAFVVKDPVFRQENDTVTGSGFQKGRSRYDLYVPQAYNTGTPWVRHEDFVAGVNLNNVTVVEDGETDLEHSTISRADFMDATSLLVRNTLHQIRRGTYVHSDAHGGNFRITADNKKLAVFDRYNLIEMTDSMRTTLQNAIVSLASGDQHGAVSSIITGVDPSVSPDTLQNLIHTVTRNLDEEDDIAKGMANTVVALKKAGIAIPVNLSLILRNMFSMTQLADRAGFDNIVTAFMHTASEEEVADLLESFGN